MWLARLLLASSLTLSPVLLAEIEKIAIAGEAGIELYWWPRLPALAGWHHDRDFSLRYSANALAPDGFTFANAEAVIYAKAIYKPRRPSASSLAVFIAEDRAAFLSESPSLRIADAPPLSSGDGTELPSLTFSPSGPGNWERVAYAEEGEYYLVFTVSARTQSGFTAALAPFTKLLCNYRAAP